MRLIDADVLYRAYERAAWYNNADRDEVAEEILRQVPTVDAVPVVRCRDCKRAKPTDDTFYCELWSSFPDDADTGFCLYGERRANE